MPVRIQGRWVAAVALIAALFATQVEAQTATLTSTQILDRVFAFGATRVIEMQFNDPARTTPYVDDGVSGAGILECKLTSLGGLYCLDGMNLRRWPNPKHPSPSEVVLRCDDPALNLDWRKANPCTTVTVDQSGVIWLAGRKGNAHSLLRVIAKGTTGCSAGYTALQYTPGLCVREYAAGRPIVLDADIVDGEVAAALGAPYGTGVLALEDRKKVVFFRDQFGSAPVEIASGKSGWGLQSSETLLGVTLLQIGSSPSVSSYALVTTSRGRVLAANLAGGATFQVYDATTAASRNGASVCNTSTAQYGVRASKKSGRVYLSDRNYCRVLALQPTAVSSSGQFVLTSVLEAGNPLTLYTGTIAVDSPTIAPGISIDLEDCYEVCDLVTTASGPAATMEKVQLGSVASGLTLFQITGITDCRWAPSRCDTALLSQMIVDPDNRGNPAAQFLNVTPLLPREITDLFIARGGLPKLLISPQYRGQSANNFVFQAFFGVPEEDVIFRDQGLAEFHIAALAGRELGCQLNYPAGTPVANLLKWDIAVKASENFLGVNLPGLNDTTERHVDTLLNVGCGSSRAGMIGWSIVPYNLELTPNTYDGTRIVNNNDAVFGRLLSKLYGELDLARAQLACVNVDGAAGNPPLSPAICNSLASQWANGKDKLDKCLYAATQLKQSSGDQNCQAFQVQLRSYKNTVDGASLYGIDPANRLGELGMRVDVIFHVLLDRFVPSVPTKGFCVETNSCTP